MLSNCLKSLFSENTLLSFSEGGGGEAMQGREKQQQRANWVVIYSYTNLAPSQSWQQRTKQRKKSFTSISTVELLDHQAAIYLAKLYLFSFIGSIVTAKRN